MEDSIYEQLDQEYEKLLNKISVNEQTKNAIIAYNRFAKQH